jgi:DNA adenine methylase
MDRTLKKPEFVPGQKSFIAWMGGKSRLAETIIKMAPEHSCFVEVFGGAGWVTFKKTPSEVEIINDINKDLTNLYRVIQHHLPEFIRQFEWMLVSGDEFARLKDVAPATLTDIQRAARFYYMIKNAFGARLRGISYGISSTTPPRLNLSTLEASLGAARDRLQRVHIDHLPYAQCLERFDRPHTWFYIDPPYYNCEADYGSDVFSKADFISLAAQLGSIQGKFTLSINDQLEVRKIFKAFKCTEVMTRYSVSAKKSGSVQSKPVQELIFTNY